MGLEEPTGDEDSDRILATTTTTIEILEALKELNGSSVTELADHLDLSKGGVHNHLSTLYEHDYVIRDGNTYKLSSEFILMGEHVRQENLLYQFGKEKLDELTQETGEYGQLVTENHGVGNVIYLSRGDKAIGSDYPQHMEKKPLYLHHTAAGKSILAHLPKDRVEEVIDQYDLFERTENTITDREEFYEELKTVRERGYAYNREEEVVGLKAIGAPIFGPNDEVLGALSLSGPRSRMKGNRFNETLPSKVTSAAEVIEVNINMHYKTNEF